MSSIYSWFWPHLCDQWRTELLKIVKTGQVGRKECDETLSYLQRRDVKAQVDGYIKKTEAITCTEHYAKTLDLVILEVDLFDQNQTLILLAYYLLYQWQENDLLGAMQQH